MFVTGAFADSSRCLQLSCAHAHEQNISRQLRDSMHGPVVSYRSLQLLRSSEILRRREKRSKGQAGRHTLTKFCSLGPFLEIENHNKKLMATEPEIPPAMKFPAWKWTDSLKENGYFP